ncbi:MAG: hypothetical protein ABIK37_03035 [candidate division WOR-3 bacterium]
MTRIAAKFVLGLLVFVVADGWGWEYKASWISDSAATTPSLPVTGYGLVGGVSVGFMNDPLAHTESISGGIGPDLEFGAFVDWGGTAWGQRTELTCHRWTMPGVLTRTGIRLGFLIHPEVYFSDRLGLSFDAGPVADFLVNYRATGQTVYGRIPRTAARRVNVNVDFGVGVAIGFGSIWVNPDIRVHLPAFLPVHTAWQPDLEPLHPWSVRLGVGVGPRLAPKGPQLRREQR